MRQVNWSTSAHHYEMSYFLPGLKSLWRDEVKSIVFDFDPDNELSIYEKNQRLGSPSHWRFYFAFDKPSYALDDNLIINFLRTASADWKSAANMLRKLAVRPHGTPAHYLDVFLDRLLDQRDKFDSSIAVGIARAFADMMDEVSRSIAARFSGGDPWEKVLRLLGKEVGPYFKEIVSEGRSLNWLADAVRDQGFAFGFGEEASSRPGRQWMERSEFDEVVAIILKRFRDEGLPKIFDLPEPLEVLLCWHQLGDAAELKREFAKAAESEEIFLKGLNALRTWASSSERGLYRYLSRQIVSYFMDEKIARERLQNIMRGPASDARNIGMAGELLAAWNASKL